MPTNHSSICLLFEAQAIVIGAELKLKSIKHENQSHYLPEW